MQTLGAEWGRDLIASDLWTMAWRQAAKAALANGAPGIVAEDCRYENEAVAIRALGGVVVRILRPTALPQVGAHATEAQGSAPTPPFTTTGRSRSWPPGWKGYWTATSAAPAQPDWSLAESVRGS